MPSNENVKFAFVTDYYFNFFQKHPKCRTIFYYPDTAETFQIMQKFGEMNDPVLSITPFGQTPSDSDDITPTDVTTGKELIQRLYNNTLPNNWTAQGAIFFNISLDSYSYLYPNQTLITYEVNI